jgi:methylaspartate mutase sigma subunit
MDTTPDLQRKGRVVTGVIGADVHVVGNRLLAAALEQAGFRVVNLGVLVTQEEFINAAIESNADALLISSLYGHAELDCQGLRDKCVEAGLEEILIYVGGNIALGKQAWPEVEQRFLALGIDRVFPPRTQGRDLLARSRPGPAQERSRIDAGPAGRHRQHIYKDDPG